MGPVPNHHHRVTTTQCPLHGRLVHPSTRQCCRQAWHLHRSPHLTAKPWQFGLLWTRGSCASACGNIAPSVWCQRLITPLLYLAYTAEGRGCCALPSPPELTSQRPSCATGCAPAPDDGRGRVWRTGSREEGWVGGLPPLHHLKKLLVDAEGEKFCKKS